MFIIDHLSFIHFQEKYGPVGLIHVDAHTDVYGDYLGHRVHHGNTFLLANEEGCLDPTRTIQIGLRGSGMGSKCGTDYDKSRSLVSFIADCGE